MEQNIDFPKKECYIYLRYFVCAHERNEVSIISATIKEIALACGVSEGTVDRALNGREGIKIETKERILQTAKEMGYRPNHLARSLARGRSGAIGVVCAGLSNPFFSSFVEAIERVAYENGYYLNLILAHGSREKEMEGIQYLAGRQVEGLIIMPLGYGEEYEQALLNLNIPIVTVYNRLSDKFIHVDVDGRLIMKNAVHKIVEKGYGRIAYLDLGYGTERAEQNNRYSMNQRRLGYEDGMREENLGEPVIFPKCEWETIQTFLQEGSGKPAILCSFDNLAIRVLSMLRSHGVSVPEEVGVMGFDNIPILDSISPRLCSVDCEIKDLGKKAFSALLQLINKDDTVCDYVTSYTFTDGESL